MPFKSTEGQRLAINTIKMPTTASRKNRNLQPVYWAIPPQTYPSMHYSFFRSNLMDIWNSGRLKVDQKNRSCTIHKARLRLRRIRSQVWSIWECPASCMAQISCQAQQNSCLGSCTNADSVALESQGFFTVFCWVFESSGFCNGFEGTNRLPHPRGVRWKGWQTRGSHILLGPHHLWKVPTM